MKKYEKKDTEEKKPKKDKESKVKDSKVKDPKGRKDKKGKKDEEAEAEDDQPKPKRVRKHKWWLHSFWVLSVSVANAIWNLWMVTLETDRCCFHNFRKYILWGWAQMESNHLKKRLNSQTVYLI